MSATRNNYLDYIRGIAIFLVVVGHCIQFGSGSAYLKSGLYFANPLFKFIYSFHMPLFMLISGYLGWFSISKKTHKDFVIDKCKGILIPLIAWHTLFQGLQILTNPSSISQEVFFWSYFHTLWFLRALICCYIFVLLGHKFFNDHLVFYTTVCILMLFVPNKIIPDVFVFTIPYFTIGYLFNKYQSINRVSRSLLNPLAYGMIGLFFLLFLHFYKDNYYAYVSKTYLFNGKYSILFMIFVNLYRNLTAILGCIFMLLTTKYLSKFLARSKTNLFFTTIGQVSLCIYIINHYVNELVLLNLPINKLSYLNVLIESVVIICFAYFCSQLLKKNRLLRILFLGGR